MADMFEGSLVQTRCFDQLLEARKKHVKLIHVYGISSSVKSSYDVCLFVVVVTYLN